MKIQFLIGLLLGCHLTMASEVEDQEKLWQQVEKESAFKPVAIQSEGISGEINGYVLPNGDVKLYQVGQELQTTAQIASPEFSRYADEERYRIICANGASRFPEIRLDKHPYTLTFKILPMQQDQELVISDSNGKSWRVSELQTRFKPVEFIKPSITVSADALILQTGLSQDKLTKLITNQINQNLANIQNGEVSIDLTSYDDVACDLVMGKISIQAQIGIHYDSPKISHLSRLSSNQLARIYERIRSTWQAPGNSEQTKILGGYNLGIAGSAANLDSNYLNDYEVVRLFGLLFDANQAGLKTIASADYPMVAQKMDRLSSGDAWSVSTYKTNLVKPKFGRKWF